MNLRNCPPEYYENCLNAARWCLRCAAGYGRKGSKLYYQPRDETLAPHPHGTDRERSYQIKRARREEAKARESLVRATVNSGAVYGDGDYLIAGWLRCDHKHRQKPGKQFYLSLAEYHKGLKQGIESWIITIHPQEGETLRGVFLTEQAFARLLREANVSLDVEQKE